MNKIKIVTERTELRLIELSDLEAIHILHSLPETDEYNVLGIPNDIDETRTVILPWIIENVSAESKNFTFAIEEKLTKNFIGLFGFRLSRNKYRRGEVWYKIHANHWNNGYATEVLSAIIDFGFDKLNLHRIEAGCAVDNIGSIKVLEKVGMIREGRGRKILPLKTGWSDNFEYAILETDERRKFPIR